MKDAYVKAAYVKAAVLVSKTQLLGCCVALGWALGSEADAEKLVRDFSRMFRPDGGPGIFWMGPLRDKEAQQRRIYAMLLMAAMEEHS